MSFAPPGARPGKKRKFAPDDAMVEKGIYTPTMPNSGTAMTGNFLGTYSRVGYSVTVAIYLDINSVTGASGVPRVSLPFYVDNTAGGTLFQALPVAYASVDPTDNDTMPRDDMNGVFLRLTPGSSTGSLAQYKNHNTDTAGSVGFQLMTSNATVFTSAAILYITGTYITSGVMV